MYILLSLCSDLSFKICVSLLKFTQHLLNFFHMLLIIKSHIFLMLFGEFFAKILQLNAPFFPTYVPQLLLQ